MKPGTIASLIVILIVLVILGGIVYAVAGHPASPVGPSGPPEQGSTPPPASTTPPSASSTPSQPASSAVELDSVNPSSGAVGGSITLVGSGFTGDNKVLFDGMVAAADAHPASSADGRQTLVIAVPSSMGADCKPDQACPMFEALVSPRAYSVSVENADGVSNAVPFTVTGAPLQP
jgi:hypothetical protein